MTGGGKVVKKKWPPFLEATILTKLFSYQSSVLDFAVVSGFGDSVDSVFAVSSFFASIVLVGTFLPA